jgi:hypothetical protein
MARPVTSIRPRTTEYRSIDIAWLRRKGARHVGYSGRIRWSRDGVEHASIDYAIEAAGLRLRYRVTSGGGAPQHIDELVPIVSTAMHLGGCRHWFACPSCGRRCRILYGGARFRCRLCRGAGYESQYESRMLSVCGIRWCMRARLEERGSRLASVLGLDDGFPDKPPRMHWSTYRRLEARDRKLAGRWRDSAQEWLERREGERIRLAGQLARALREQGLAAAREPAAPIAPPRTKTPGRSRRRKHGKSRVWHWLWYPYKNYRFGTYLELWSPRSSAGGGHHG